MTHHYLICAQLSKANLNYTMLVQSPITGHFPLMWVWVATKVLWCGHKLSLSHTLLSCLRRKVHLKFHCKSSPFHQKPHTLLFHMYGLQQGANCMPINHTYTFVLDGHVLTAQCCHAHFTDLHSVASTHSAQGMPQWYGGCHDKYNVYMYLRALLVGINVLLYCIVHGHCSCDRYLSALQLWSKHCCIILLLYTDTAKYCVRCSGNDLHTASRAFATVHIQSTVTFTVNNLFVSRIREKSGLCFHQ